MACILFKELDSCFDCDDRFCSLNDGIVDPHDLCGCYACEWHSMDGDRLVCINGEFVESAQKEQ